MKKLITTDSTPNKGKLVNKYCLDGISETDCSRTTNKTVDGSFSIGDKIPDNPFKVKDESIEINCPIKVDGEVLEIDLSRLDEEEKKQFHSLLKKIQKSKVWKPEHNEQYWFIDVNGISWAYYDSTVAKHACDFRYSIGNCYRVKEDAEFALEKLKVETEINRYIEEHDPIKIDWNDKKQHKHYLVYNSTADRLESRDCMTIKQFGTVYFSPKFNLYKMTITIGTDRIKKYIFGVE